MNKEQEIYWNLKENLPRDVLNAVSESLITMFENATEVETKDAYGDFSKVLHIKQQVEDSISEATVTIRFKNVSMNGSEKGYSVKLSGKSTDGTYQYESEWNEIPVNYINKGDIKDLVALVEDISLTDWTYTRIELFFEYLRDNLKDLKEGVA